MTIIIGLGNPGEQYKNTRHNIGFMVLDKFAEKNSFPEFNLQKKYSAEISEGNFGEKTVLLVKPQTFMNNSGKTALSLLKQNKEAEIIIIHDDIDLEIGKMKIVKERGSAGHKGVESIINTIGNENLIRVRVGIGGDKNTEAMKIVLKKFSSTEQNLVNKAIDKACNSLDILVKEGLDKAMNEYNK